MPVRLWNGEAYPRARLDRDGLEDADPFLEAPGALQRPRVWGWTLFGTTINTRSTAVSPRFIGPALVVGVTLTFSYTTANARPLILTLRYGATPTGGGHQQTDTTLPDGASVFEPISQHATGLGQVLVDPEGWPLQPVLSNASPVRLWLRRIVPLREFYLKVSLNKSNGVLETASGTVEVIDQYDPALLVGH